MKLPEEIHSFNAALAMEFAFFIATFTSVFLSMIPHVTVKPGRTP